MCFPLASSGGPGDGWARFLVPIGHGPAPGIPLTLRSLGCDVTVSADGWYCYTQGRDPVVLHGQNETDRRLFRPVVTYEISTDKDKWRRLRPDDEQSRSDSVTVSPDNPIINVTIDMEPFRGWIGTYRYGRVVLENGDADIIELEDLLPTADARDAAGNFKEDVAFGGAMLRHEFKLPRPNDPAVLSKVISLGGQLVGEFIFSSRLEAVSLKGTRTLDGDFWPTATFYAGNSLTEWKEVGKSQNSGTSATLQITSGKAETLRILLTDYKREMSKYKYGKIVFPNGQSTIFYLDLLDPKS
jgi:hypothetical protein